MTDFAYAPGQVLDFIGTVAEVEARILTDFGKQVPLLSLSVPDMNSYDAYPQQFFGVPADPYEAQSGEQQDGVLPSGHWQTTRLFSDVPLAEAQDIARKELAPWYHSYVGSYFQAGTKWYSAKEQPVTNFQNISTFINGGLQPIDYVIVDTAGDMSRIQTNINWTNFLTAWHALYIQAQADLETAWIGVRDALTTDAVRTIMTNLPPIPTDPNNPGP